MSPSPKIFATLPCPSPPLTTSIALPVPLNVNNRKHAFSSHLSNTRSNGSQARPLFVGACICGPVCAVRSRYAVPGDAKPFRDMVVVRPGLSNYVRRGSS